MFNHHRFNLGQQYNELAQSYHSWYITSIFLINWGITLEYAPSPNRYTSFGEPHSHQKRRYTLKKIE